MHIQCLYGEIASLSLFFAKFFFVYPTTLPFPVKIDINKKKK